jgi:hypothetical protein
VLKKRTRRPEAAGRRRADAPARITAGTRLTFRAELMPGRRGAERTFTVARVLAAGRVELVGLSGQHAETEFEPSGQ